MTTTAYCDKCKENTDYLARQITITMANTGVSRMDEDHQMRDMHLCSFCYPKFQDWMETR